MKLRVPTRYISAWCLASISAWFLCNTGVAAHSEGAPVRSRARYTHHQRPRLEISFDTSAVDQLLAFIANKQATPDEVNRWMSLPANQYILQVGSQEGGLSLNQFKENLSAAIDEVGDTKGADPFDVGNLSIHDVNNTKAMFTRLKKTLDQRAMHIVFRDIAFEPSNISVNTKVYLHLGGDWDAVNSDGAIYVNIRFWTEGVVPSWDGLNMVVAHELMHSIQNEAYGNPERQDDSAGAFLTALSKIQREGTARYVEFNTDFTAYGRDTYGFEYRAIDSEHLRDFRTDVRQLQDLYDACYPKFDHPKFVEAFGAGINEGGPYYDIGEAIAQAIDTKLGRPALIKTISFGPKAFFMDYDQLCRHDDALPKLPPAFAKAVSSMRPRL